MAIIDSFSPLANFWEKHQQLLVVKAFKEFYEGDPSENKAQSSRIMWAVGLVYDYESEYALQNLENRIVLVEKDYLEQEGFFEAHAQHLAPLIESYMYLQKDALRRSLTEWEEGLDKRTQFLRDTPYTIQNGPKIDKMRSDTKKQFETLAQLKNEYLTKKLESNIKGDYKPSLRETGKL